MYLEIMRTSRRRARKASNRESTLRRTSVVLLPPGIEALDRRAGYANWVDTSVLQPLRQANSNLFGEALTSICNMITDGDSEAEAFGSVFLANLPESSRQYLLTRYPDRVRRWGLEATKNLRS